MQPRFEAEHADGRREKRTSTLCEYSDPAGYWAMAKLVAVPCGVAIKQVLDGTISEREILTPMTPGINNPLMEESKKFRTELVEETLA